VPVRTPRPARAGRLAALVATAALAVAACATGGTATTPSPTPTLGPTPLPSANPYTGATPGSGASIKLGYLSYGDLVPYVKQISDGIRAQAATAGVDLVTCDANVDPAKVDGCMKQLTDAGIKGLIQFQGSLKLPSEVCATVPQGVPVLAVDLPEEPCAATLVAADDLRAGQVAGAAVGAWVKAHWTCTYDAYVSLESSVVPDRNQLRMEGYRQGFKTACPGPITNEQVGGSADREDTARDAVASLLETLPGKSRIVVVAMNDDGALGALDAAKAAGREADVWVSGQGAEAKVRDLIRTNEHYLGDAAYFPERFGATIVPAMLDLIAGKPVAKLLLVEPAWVDRTTIGTIYPN
jgi:ribose transport system substrate-binding protein